MSIGEKIKECRKKAGLSQEQLAEKLCVARQAVTKWESDKGMPYIENLQNISKLLGMSIDYLLDNGKTLSNTVIKEVININDYEKEGKKRSRYDAVVRVKYPQATIIYPLIRRKKLSLVENTVELEQKQLLVNVTKEFIESRELNCKFTEKKIVIGNTLFKKCSYTI